MMFYSSFYILMAFHKDEVVLDPVFVKKEKPSFVISVSCLGNCLSFNIIKRSQAKTQYSGCNSRGIRDT
jgi:F0F1-type ATP synthase assembly protein I